MSLFLPWLQARKGNKVAWQTQWWCSYVFTNKPWLRQLIPLWCDSLSLSLSSSSLSLSLSPLSLSLSLAPLSLLSLSSSPSLSSLSLILSLSLSLSLSSPPLSLSLSLPLSLSLTLSLLSSPLSLSPHTHNTHKTRYSTLHITPIWTVNRKYLNKKTYLQSLIQTPYCHRKVGINPFLEIAFLPALYYARFTKRSSINALNKFEHWVVLFCWKQILTNDS